MIRLGVLLFLLVSTGGQAETLGPYAGRGFDNQLAAQVYAAALTFMAPRTLEAISTPQMAIWGLHGLAAIDPRLTPELRDGVLSLSASDRLLYRGLAPPDGSASAWGIAIAEMTRAAWDTSGPIRAAGTQGLIQSFFDELFNHLDPYSRYVPPDAATEDRGRRSGQGGIGVTLARRGRSVTIAEVIADSPADEAGLRAGDSIISVDGQSAFGQPPGTVSDWIAGPEDTPVNIVWRGRNGRVRSADLTRALIAPETVYAQRQGVALMVRITSFNRGTEDRLAEALHQQLSGPRPPAGIVIDLRGNRGGLLRQAVAAANLLIDHGVIAVTEGRDPEATRVLEAAGHDVSPGTPVVVMVDGRSASAAEVLAAALSDQGRAVVVGSSTLGKGLVQTITQLPDGGELFVTWSRILAPLGWPIQGLGVMPQVCTSLGADEVDRELDNLAHGQAPMARALQRHRTARAPLPAAQIVAIRSACPAAEGREADLVVARRLIEQPASYVSALLPPLAAGPSR